MNGNQLTLFPLGIELDYPYEPSSAVLRRKVRAEDGLTYAIKGKTGDNDFTPVNEWICASIGNAIAIPIPPFKLLIDQNGNKYFGSQWGAGPLKSHALYFKEVEDPSLYSAIMAFDMLILNGDRHLGNYLILEVDKKNKLFAFDHGNALLHTNPLPDSLKIINPHDNFFDILKQHGLKPNKKRVEGVLEKFRALPTEFFDKIVLECDHWLSNEQSTTLREWLVRRSSCITKINEYIGGLL